MTVGDLRKLLRGHDPETLVLVNSQHEGYDFAGDLLSIRVIKRIRGPYDAGKFIDADLKPNSTQLPMKAVVLSLT